jgi:hypothetical protein
MIKAALAKTRGRVSEQVRQPIRVFRLRLWESKIRSVNINKHRFRIE